MKTVEQLIFEKRFKDAEFDPNDYNDWAKENEYEAYTLCLAVAKQLQQHLVMQAEGSERPNEKLFCKVYEQEYGEKTNSIYQIVIDTFDGGELLTLCHKYHLAASAKEAAVGQRSGGTNAESVAFNCVSSDSLVYNKPCKEWCGNPYCKSEAPAPQHY